MSAWLMYSDIVNQQQHLAAYGGFGQQIQYTYPCNPPLVLGFRFCMLATLVTSALHVLTPEHAYALLNIVYQ